MAIPDFMKDKTGLTNTTFRQHGNVFNMTADDSLLQNSHDAALNAGVRYDSNTA